MSFASPAEDAGLPQRPYLKPKRLETDTRRRQRQEIKKLLEEQRQIGEACEVSSAKVEEAAKDLEKTAHDSKKFPLPRRSG